MTKPIVLAMLSTLSLSITQVYAVTSCSINKQVNDYNRQIMFIDTTLGHVREKALITTGSGDDGSQLSTEIKYQYNRCGEVIRLSAQQKNIGKFTTMVIVLNANKTADGWQVNYDASVTSTQDGKSELVYRKIGNPYYYTDKSGKITHAQDNFIANGQKGVTKREYQSDAQDRLISYITRGDDKLMNGKNSNYYNDQNLLFSSVSPSTHSNYIYDQQGRDLQMISLTVNTYSLHSTKVDCHKWDDAGNCLSATSSEIEIYPHSVVKRDSVLETTITYWND